MDWIDLILLILAGLAGGFLSGLLGVGGGIIFIPILDIVFTNLGIPPEMMVPCILANSLFIIIFTSLLNSRRQYINKNFYPMECLFTGLGGVITSLATSWILQNLFDYNKATFNLIFAGLLTPLVIKMVLSKPKETTDKELPSRKKFFLTGIFTGVFTALSGLGGGLIMIPVFTDILKIDIKKASSISAGTAPILALPITLFYIWQGRDIQLDGIGHWGYVVYSVSLVLMAGVFMTVSLGVNTANRLPSRVVKNIFAGFAAIVLGKMIIEALLKL